MQSVWVEPEVNMGPQFNFALGLSIWCYCAMVRCSASSVADKALSRKTVHIKSLHERGWER